MTEQLNLGLDDVPAIPRSGVLRRFHAKASTCLQDALDGERRAERQEEILMRWWGSVGSQERFTPSEVHTHVSGGCWPLTSTRRAITNLTKAGLLVHHPQIRRVGPFGVNESTWSLSDTGRTICATTAEVP